MFKEYFIAAVAAVWVVIISYIVMIRKKEKDNLD